MKKTIQPTASQQVSALLDKASSGGIAYETFSQELRNIKGAPLNVCANSKPYNTALHIAVLEYARTGSSVSWNDVQWLSQKGKSLVNAVNSDSLTPLQVLLNDNSATHKMKALFCLLKNGARKTTVDASRSTILHLMVTNLESSAFDKDINEFLNANPSTLNARDAAGQTPFKNLISIMNAGNVQLLLPRALMLAKAGADVKETNSKNTNLLHFLAAYGTVEQMQALAVSAKAIANAENDNKNRPLDILVKRLDADKLSTEQFEQMAEKLCALGADFSKYSERFPQLKKETKVVAVDDSSKPAADNNPQNPKTESVTSSDTSSNLGNDQNDSSKATKKPDDIPVAIKTPRDKAIEKLKNEIKLMREYGKTLGDKHHHLSKGKKVIDLANDLDGLVVAFQDPKSKYADFAVFDKEFKKLIKNKEKAMSQYRVAWGTIVANVLIALTGVGAVAILCSLAYSAATKGRCLFFFQKPTTTSEDKVAKVNEALANLEQVVQPTV